MAIGIIGGSGFYSFGEGERIRQNTPFGVSGELVSMDHQSGEKIYFLARHGKGHTVPPHRINYRANIHALYTLGVKKIIATNAVGTTQENIDPGTFAVPDQIIDFTSNREHTFFLGDSDVTAPREFKRVVHTDVSEPFSQELRNHIIETMKALDLNFVDHGTIAVSNGPRFETAAEVKMLKLLGADFLGMTSAPEAFLAKELGLEYATIGVVTNFGAGMQQHVTHDEVIEIFKQRMQTLQNIVLALIDRILSH
ncbi:MAG: S-methyl-5'-thioinosine phosphorylase [Methanobacteriota archaeon]|nr:MAG: S-methyl-5'-thioinosine phosphorylase [Euryarchaeota archaeon]